MTNLPPLTELLDLDEVGDGIFVGPPVDDGRSRVFGGQIVAQALAAASFTTGGWPCHSLHSYFLRPGKPGRPIHYEVSNLRDAKRFCSRLVTGVQRDEPIFHLAASFQADNGRIEPFQVPMPSVPTPDELPDEETQQAQLSEALPEHRREILRNTMPVEYLSVDSTPWFDETVRTPNRYVWFRSRHPLPEYENLHRCALAYSSDMFVLQSCAMTMPMSIFDPRLQVASLDHSIWFHRSFQADAWLLYAGESDIVANGRGLGRGRVFSKDGTLVATVAQEGVMHVRE